MSTTKNSARYINFGLMTLVKELTALLDRAEARLGPDAPTITGAEKRRTPKARKGAEKVLVTLAPIVEQHGLDSASLSSTTMLARLDAAQTLRPLQTRIQKLQKRVDDELFKAQSESWAMGLQFYSLLQRRAKSDGDLAQSLEPVARLFAHRHASVTSGKPTKVQTRAKAKLKKATALAARHGVGVEDAAPPQQEATPGMGTSVTNGAAPAAAGDTSSHA